MFDKDLSKDILKRLDTLIALQIKKEMKEDKSFTMREAIKLLADLDLKYTDIANIFGRSSSYIASEISQLKKRRKNE